MFVPLIGGWLADRYSAEMGLCPRAGCWRGCRRCWGPRCIWRSCRSSPPPPWCSQHDSRWRRRRRMRCWCATRPAAGAPPPSAPNSCCRGGERRWACRSSPSSSTAPAISPGSSWRLAGFAAAIVVAGLFLPREAETAGGGSGGGGRMSFAIDRIDHLVLTVRDLEASLQFSSWCWALASCRRRAGRGRPPWPSAGRRSTSMSPARSSSPRRRIRPSGPAIYLITEAPVAEVVAHLEDCGVVVEVGPVPRHGALGPMTTSISATPTGIWWKWRRTTRRGYCGSEDRLLPVQFRKARVVAIISDPGAGTLDRQSGEPRVGDARSPDARLDA